MNNAHLGNGGNDMLKVPEALTQLDVVFGNISHMPKWNDLPAEFRDNWSSNPFCRAVSMWFYKGASVAPQGILIDGVKFTPKEGVNQSHALGAIKAALGSWEPKHEHKIAGCGFMLSEWFDRHEAKK